MDVFSLVAKLTLDSSEYDRNLDKSEGKASTFGDKLKSGLATAAKVGIAAITAASGAVAALTKASVENYAEYEQLVGGVETLFGNSADTVMKYASNAYKTAGLSANEYMETVTSFSASLLQSLGGDTEQAAKIGDMAISDMADNANKMGSSMESIQNAYQGFAKQNYTMLDNLKLGYGGTKEEMERLLKDATALSGVKYDISSLSDVYNAIHVIQGELGITGTTAKEASETISGSISAMKSAWQNLVTGIADENANFGVLINQFVDSATTAAKNILPRISQEISGIGQLVSGLAPVVASALPGLVSDVLPVVLSAASDMLSAFANSVLDSGPILLNVALDAVMMLVNGLTNGGIDKMADVAIDLVITLADWIANNADKLIESAITLIITLVGALLAPENLGRMVNSALMLVLKLGEGLLLAVGNLMSPAYELVATIAKGIATKFDDLVNKGRELVNKVGDGFKSTVRSALTWGRNLVNNFKNGVLNAVGSLASAGLSLVHGIWNGISSGLDWIKGKITGWVGNVVDFIKNLFGIHSPSTVMRDQVGKFLALGIGEGFSKEMGHVNSMIENAMPDPMNLISSVDFTTKTSGKNANGVSSPVLNEIINLRNEIKNMRIYLDTGVLVGTVSKGIGEDYVSNRRRALA